MKQKFQTWMDSISTHDMVWMVAIFLASMLGTAVSGTVLKWGMLNYGDVSVTAKMMVTLAATVAYALVVLAVFYAFFPETKLALQRLWVKKK